MSASSSLFDIDELASATRLPIPGNTDASDYLCDHQQQADKQDRHILFHLVDEPTKVFPSATVVAATWSTETAEGGLPYLQQTILSAVFDVRVDIHNSVRSRCRDLPGDLTLVIRSVISAKAL
jgi:hypothetical protein